MVMVLPAAVLPVRTVRNKPLFRYFEVSGGNYENRNKKISKSFATNKVLRGVDIIVNVGKIHALMGENGAEKSIVMNILTGLHKQDSGEIIVDGTIVKFDNPMHAEEMELV